MEIKEKIELLLQLYHKYKKPKLPLVNRIPAGSEWIANLLVIQLQINFSSEV